MRAFRVFAAAAVVLLASCTQPAPTPSPPVANAPEAPTSAPTPQAPAIGTGTLMGLWRLKSLTGHTVEGEEPILAAISAHFVDAFSQCISFRFARTPGAAGWTAWAPAEGAAMCARGLTPLETAFQAFLPSITGQTLRTPDTQVMSAPGGEAVFERIDADNRATPDLFGPYRVLSVNGAAMMQPTMIVFGFERVEAITDCVVQSFQRRYIAATQFAFSPWAPMVPVCERGRSAQEDALARVLNGDVVVTTPANGQFALTGPGGRVDLAQAGAAR